MTPEQRQSQAIRAKQLLQDETLRAMFDAVASYLDDKALSCDPDSREQTQRVILAKQIFASMRREIERMAEDGDFAAFELAQLERKGVMRMFRR